jgi:hypothetical protein
MLPLKEVEEAENKGNVVIQCEGTESKETELFRSLVDRSNCERPVTKQQQTCQYPQSVNLLTEHPSLIY